MDSSIVPALSAVATGLGGIYGGFRFGKNQNLADQASMATISADTVEMLQAQVGVLQDQAETLKDQNDEKEHNIVELMARVSVLEGLVTQSANVAAVHEDVILIKNKVEAIHEAIVV